MANSPNIITEELPDIEVEIRVKVGLSADAVEDMVFPEGWFKGPKGDLILSKAQLFNWLQSDKGRKELERAAKSDIEVDGFAAFMGDMEIVAVSIDQYGWSAEVE